MATPASAMLDGQTEDMETEVQQSARWLYCGEPDDRQKAVLGKDCGAGAESRLALSPSVWAPRSPLARCLELGQSPSHPPIPLS